MAGFYHKYQAEILAAVSIFAAIVLAIVSDVKLLRPITHYGLFVVFGAYVIASLAVDKRLRTQRDRFNSTSLHRISPPSDNAYRAVLDRASSSYFLLGMSAEELQRSVPIRDYLIERSRAGKPIHQLRFLLLHPDSAFFAQRLREVNSDSDLLDLIARKKDIIRTLHHSLRALPAGVVTDYQLRFFDEFPIWLLEFTDSSIAHNRPDTMELMVHLPGRHSRYSSRYRLTADDNCLFPSFIRYFEELWGRSQPMNQDGSFPDIYKGQEAYINVIAFDLDGTLVDSEDVKRDAFFYALGKLTESHLEQFRIAYERHAAANRQEIFRLAFQDAGLGAIDAGKLKELTDSYADYFRRNLDKVRLIAGFEQFYERFKHKYRLFVVSNANQDEINQILKLHSITHCFQKVYGYPTRKVAALKEVIQDAGIQAFNILYIGDRAEDRIVAEATGTRFCSIDHKTPPGQGDSSSVRSFDELAGTIYDIEVTAGLRTL